jgi:hypothetical protein
MEVQYDTYPVAIPHRRCSWPARLWRWTLRLLGLALYGTLILYCLEHTPVVAEPQGNSGWYQLPATPWPHP